MAYFFTGNKGNQDIYIKQSYRKDNGKTSSRIYKKLGKYNDLLAQFSGDETAMMAWAKKEAEKETLLYNQRREKVTVSFSPLARIPLGEGRLFNVGYLFLQQLCTELRLDNIYRNIRNHHRFTYDFHAILTDLIYARILSPSSKLGSFSYCQSLLEPPKYSLQNLYRSLSVLAEESDYIQEELYQNSNFVHPRNSKILYHDCTNYYFEIEAEDGMKKYGKSKEHRPNPIVQMGLFMDKSGIPLAFCINPGNQNEQLSLKPLEQQIMRDFELSKFVVCTDAGLSSDANRRFNNFGERSFITTQSIKKLKSRLKEWCLDCNGWQLEGSKKTYDISEIEDTPENINKIFYKQMLVEGYDEERDIAFDQTLIVTYSLKYKLYQQTIRERLIERAKKYLQHPAQYDKHSVTDAKRFIKKTPVTNDGEVAEKAAYELNINAIKEEAKYDGFYAVCTNLDDNPAEIARINHDRWEIEESFRIMKSEFDARPVYLHRDDRIKAHFLTCFISLMIYRILEKQLDNSFTCEEIINTLRKMNVREVGEYGYIPNYTRTELTDALHDNAGFRTDNELTTPKAMAGIIRRSKGL